jgi:gliding motility-associated-like protein
VSVTQTEGPLSGENLAPGLYSVSYAISDTSGNISSCAFQIEVLDTIAPVIDCQESIQSCEPIVVFETPTATDNCSIAEIIQISGPSSGSSFPVGLTEVSFQATDVNGNTAVCSFEIEVLQQATRPEAGGDLIVCNTAQVTLNGNIPDFGSGLWVLISGEGNIVSPESPQTLVTELAEGENSFAWTIDPENGCAVLGDTLTVIVDPAVAVEAGPDVTILLDDNTTLDGSVFPPGGTILWEPPDGLSCTDCLDAVASPDETTLYFLNYTTDRGCEARDSVLVRVLFEIPNTITPDGDGVNDVWNIPGIGRYPDVNVTIYNRWGTEVFASTGYTEPWNGERNVEQLPEGSYFYIIDFKAPGEEILNGTVNIIR